MRRVRPLLRFSIQTVCMASCLISPSFSATTSLPESGDSVLHFRTFGERMLIVPVMVNGKGPFDFVFDTGSSRTMIDPSLAAQLSLQPLASEEVTTITRSMHIGLGRVSEISLASATVTNMPVGIAALEGLKSAHVRARGILGEDFCSHFDFLLDNHRRTLTFEKSPNDVLRRIRGERLDVRRQGKVEGLATAYRLIVGIHSVELGSSELSFQIDSGATLPVLFPGPAANARSEPDSMVAVATTAECDGCSEFRVRRLHVLQVGRRLLPNVLLALPNTLEKMDTDGLLPTSLFRSIFICHSGNFVIVNPEVLADSGADGKTEAPASPGGQ
jgi:hypothetical protein